VVSRTLRTLLFLAAAVPVGALALGVLVAGWVSVACLAITPLVVPAIVAFRAVVGGASWLDAQLANGLLGTSVQPVLRAPGPRGFWRSGLNVLRDATFWRQQAYLLVRMTLGFALAVGEWSLLAASAGLVAMPIWYRWTDVQLVSSWDIDSLGRALLCVPVGLAGFALAFALVRPLEKGSRALVDGLLADVDAAAFTPDAIREQRVRAVKIHAFAYGVFNGALILVWAATSAGYFWPEWTLIVFGLPLAVHAWVELVDERPGFAQRLRIPRALALHAGISTALALFFVLVWAVTSRGYFWPGWIIGLLGLAVVIHAGVVFAQRDSKERIAVLEETRAGAVEQQESELERIERDLHDGAQARLVALGMSLGMAEQKLGTDPAEAQKLLAEARLGTREALEELRRLARGIHPPVLADRGLEAAVTALADRTPLRVNVAIDLPRRPPRAAETAAYFVVAEALANTGKYAGADRVDIDVHADDGRLVVAVVDDGRGGADPAGSGLLGLSRRVEALDGRLDVVSPAGGPTTIRAVIPCEW
jgi:signal transduction histidine kinase